MDLAAKLQLKDHPLKIVNAPSAEITELLESDRAIDVSTTQALLIFATNLAELKRSHKRVVLSAIKDHVTWVAYPKAGQLGTDLNRDSFAGFLIDNGVQPVRQVAINDVWSALRFRAQ